MELKYLYSDLLPRRLQSSRLIDLRQHFCYFHVTFSVIFVNTSDYRAARGLLTWTGHLLTLMPLHRGISFKIRLPQLVFWSLPIAALFRLRGAITATLVHDFPSLDDALKRARPGIDSNALLAL